MEDEPTPPTLTPDTPAGAGLIWKPAPEMRGPDPRAPETLSGRYTGGHDEDGICGYIFEIQPDTWPEGHTLWVDAAEVTLTGQMHDVPTPDPVHAVLDSGWTLTAPEGTDKRVLDFVVEKLEEGEGLWSVEAAASWVEDDEERRNAPPAPERERTPAEQRWRDMTVQAFERLNDDSAILNSFLFGDRMAGSGPVIYDTVQSKPQSWFSTNPSGPEPSWVKRRFIDGEQPYHWRGDDDGKWKRELLGNWTHDEPPVTDENLYGGRMTRHRGTTGPVYGHIAVAGAGGVLHHYAAYVDADGTVYRDLSSVPDLARLTAQWAAAPPKRPGWTGTIARPPRPVPIKPTPWETLPKGVLIEPGASSDPHARILKLKNGKWEDVGPAFPDGLPPAYRGKPAPIPWDSPLADPIADLRAAAENPDE